MSENQNLQVEVFFFVGVIWLVMESITYHFIIIGGSTYHFVSSPLKHTAKSPHHHRYRPWTSKGYYK